MANIPLPEDDNLSNLYIDNLEGIAIQETQPTNPKIEVWVQLIPPKV
jgi:hypothetical protein